MTLACNLAEVSCWVITGERQAARIRGLYLKAILRQDISFFDKETNSGEVVGRMSGDTVLIQEAMGEKVLMDHSSNPKSSQFHQTIIRVNFLVLFLGDISVRKVHTECVKFSGSHNLSLHKGLASEPCPSIFCSSSCPLRFLDELSFCKDGISRTISLC